MEITLSFIRVARRAAATLGLLCLVWQGAVEAETPTVLDPTFNAGLGASDDVFALALQPDGKILAAGQFISFDGAYRSHIARMNASGSLDTSFAPDAGANGDVYAIALQPDGRILIGGAFTSVNGHDSAFVARLNANGTPDTTFVGTANSELRALVVQPDGKILIAGRFTTIGGTPRNRVARLNDDGTLDTTFDPGAGANDNIRTLVRQSDGKILIGGQFTAFDGTTRLYLARLNANGHLDDTFNPATLNGTVRAIAARPDGKVLAAGDFALINGTKPGRLVRLLDNGTLDPSFTAPTISGATIRGIALQPDNKVLLGGDFTFVANLGRGRVARLLPDGDLDTWRPGLGADDEVFALAVQGDGMIVVGGQFTTFDTVSNSRVARLFGDTSVNSFDFLASSYPVTETDGAVILTVRRNGSTAATQEIDVQVSGGTATAGLDYQATTNHLTFGPGQSSITVTIPIFEDALIEPTETVNVSLRNPTPGVILGVRSNCVVSIADRTTLVEFSGVVAPTAEGPYGFAEAFLVRTGWLGGTTVGCRGISGTATAGLDFQDGTNYAYFTLGQQYASAIILIINDGLVEPTEQFTLSIVQVFGARSGARTNVTVNIMDNDAPLQFVTTTFDGSEQAGGVTAIIRRGDDGPGVETVHYATSPGTAQAGSDYASQSGTLTFNPGEVLKTITIPVVQDCVVEPTETFTLTLSNPTGGAVLGANSSATLRISDNAAPGSPDATFHPPTQVDQPFVVQADGRIIVATNELFRRGLIRLQPDGSPDSSFDARLVLEQESFSSITTLASQPDGKVLVAGWRLDTEGFAFHHLIRLHGDGSRDTNFTGIYELGRPDEEIRAISVQSDSRILVGGAFTFVPGSVPRGLRRLATDGTPDEPFDNNLGTGLFGSNGVHCIAIQSDGRILVGGDFLYVDGVQQSSITRLNADGTRDTNFVAGFRVNGTVHSVVLSSLLVPTTNSIGLVVGGPAPVTNRVETGGNSGHIHLEYDFLSSPDLIRIYYQDALIFESHTSGPGVVDVNYGPGDSTAVSIVMNEGDSGLPGTIWQYVGRIDTLTRQELPVIAGNFNFVDNISRNGIARLHPDGLLDTTFDPGTGANPALVEALVAQSGGRVLLGGSFNSLNGVALSGVARLNSDGSVDTNYFADPRLFVSQLGTQPDGRVLAGGFIAPDGTNYALVRLSGEFVARFSSIQKLGPNQVQLILTGPAGSTHRIETSANLRSWTPLGNVAFNGCPATFNDTSAVVGSRFYRTVQIQP